MAAALVDVDVRVAQDVALERLLAHQHDLADRGRLGVLAEERDCAWPSGRSRSTRAASSRRGSASGRSAGRRGRPGGSRSACAGRASGRVLPIRPRIVPPLTREPFLSGLGTKSRGSRRRPSSTIGPASSTRELLVAAGRPGVRAVGVGEQALLGRQRGRQRGAGGAQALLGRPACAALTVRDAPDGAREVALLVAEAARLRRGIALGQRELAPLRLALLRERIGLRQLAEARVEVGVAVAVLQLDEVAEPARVADAADAAVLDGDHGRALAAEDADRAARAVGLDDVGDVLARLEALARARSRAARRRRWPWRRPGSGPGSGP